MESNKGPLIPKQAVQTATLPPRPNHDGILAPKYLIWSTSLSSHGRLGFHKQAKLCTIHEYKRVYLIGGSNSIAFYKSWDVCSLNEVFPLKFGGKSLQTWTNRKQNATVNNDKVDDRIVQNNQPESNDKQPKEKPKIHLNEDDNKNKT